MTELAFLLSRTVVIRARRETVFRYFTDSERFARWWGAGSLIEPTAGGRVHIVYPNGATASGRVESIAPPEHIAFTYGYDDPAKPIATGGSLVTITLREVDEGTELRLDHRVANEAVRDMHVPGWRYQLAVFAHVVALEQHAGAAGVIDRYLAAWNENDPTKREKILSEVAAPSIRYADAFGLTQGVDELAAHIAAARQHFAAVELERRGEVRQAHGTAIAEWVAVTPGGETAMAGTNVFELAADGRIARVVGIASAARE